MSNYEQTVKHYAEPSCNRDDQHRLSVCGIHRPSGKKHFKARLEFPDGDFHSIEVWMQAENIIEAGDNLMTYFGSLGITAQHVKKLIEINETS